MEKNELSFDDLNKVAGGMRFPGLKGPLIPPTTGPTMPTFPVEKPLVFLV
ncbi:MAG: hypothetical protein PS018_07095 [bacterium]|nr:hypothetical protein [bacterium]